MRYMLEFGGVQYGVMVPIEGLLIYLGSQLDVRLGLQMFISLLVEQYRMILSNNIANTKLDLRNKIHEMTTYSRMTSKLVCEQHNTRTRRCPSIP